jgi:hypothetical protein
LHLTHLRHGAADHVTPLARVRQRIAAHQFDVRARRDLRLTLSGYYGWAAQAELRALLSRS